MTCVAVATNICNCFARGTTGTGPGAGGPPAGSRVEARQQHQLAIGSMQLESRGADRAASAHGSYRVKALTGPPNAKGVDESDWSPRTMARGDLLFLSHGYLGDIGS